jgi:3-oxoadipate enol-lactonase
MPTVPVPGGHLHYERAGQGPLVVLLHGIGGSGRSWRHQLTGLADAFTVVAWDARGYGGSSDPPEGWTIADFADDLAALLDQLGTERAHVVGMSMGGVIALAFAARHPQRLARLVLADTYCGGGTLPPAERQARLERRLAAVASGSLAQFARERAGEVLSSQAPPALRAEVKAIMAALHPAGYRQAAIALANADYRPVLSSITAPTLVIWGSEDRVLSRAESERLAAGIPGARLAIIEGAGHASNQERPEEFNRLVRAFLLAALG